MSEGESMMKVVALMNRSMALIGYEVISFDSPRSMVDSWTSTEADAFLIDLTLAESYGQKKLISDVISLSAEKPIIALLDDEQSNLRPFIVSAGIKCILHRSVSDIDIISALDWLQRETVPTTVQEQKETQPVNAEYSDNMPVIESVDNSSSDSNPIIIGLSGAGKGYIVDEIDPPSVLPALPPLEPEKQPDPPLEDSTPDAPPPPEEPVLSEPEPPVVEGPEPPLPVQQEPQLPPSIDPPEPPKQPEQPTRHLIGTAIIAVFSASSGAGGTHTAMVLAYWLRRNGYRVACLELNQSGQYSRMGLINGKAVPWESNYRLHGIDFVWGKSVAELKASKQYDYIVLDYGALFELDAQGQMDLSRCYHSVQKPNSLDEFHRADLQICVGRANPLTLPNLLYFLEQSPWAGISRPYWFGLVGASRRDMRELQFQHPGHQFFEIPDQPDQFDRIAKWPEEVLAGVLPTTKKRRGLFLAR